jgi:hypothetical protein
MSLQENQLNRQYEIQPFFLTALLISCRYLISCKNMNKNTEKQIVATLTERQELAIVILIGAGVITREKMTPELDKEYRVSLTLALYTGRKILIE